MLSVGGGGDHSLTKIDKDFPLSCATFANYFLLTQRYSTVEPLARKAIEQTDVNAIASDGWYLLARKEQIALFLAGVRIDDAEPLGESDVCHVAGVAHGAGFLATRTDCELA